MGACNRKKSIQDFLQRMTSCLNLTDQERDALYFAVDRKLEGETYARQNRSVRRFMSVASPEAPPLLLLQQDGTPLEAAFFAADPRAGALRWSTPVLPPSSSFSLPWWSKALRWIIISCTRWIWTWPKRPCPYYSITITDPGDFQTSTRSTAFPLPTSRFLPTAKRVAT